MASHSTLNAELAIDLPTEELIILTTQLLADLIDQEGVPCSTLYNSTNAPTIPLEDFVRRIHRYTQFSKECLVIAIIYIDRYNMEEE